MAGPDTKKIRWGVLSTARIVGAVARGIRASCNGELAAIASRTQERAEAYARDNGIPLAFGSYQALIDSGTVDAIYNPLPNSMHAEWTIRALEAGIPVLCEKPLAPTAAGVLPVLEARDRTGLPVAEAFMYRFHPMYDRVFALIAEGAIGKVVTVHGVFTWYMDNPNHIANSVELAGGALRDVGCYPVNLARRVAGCEPVRGHRVRRGSGVDLTLSGVLDFPNGMVAEVHCSLESYERHRAEILGTQGAIVLDSPWLTPHDHGEILLHRNNAVERILTPGADPYRLECEEFARAVLDGTPLRWPLEDALANMRALDLLA